MSSRGSGNESGWKRRILGENRKWKNVTMVPQFRNNVRAEGNIGKE